MELILLRDVEKVGLKGDVVRVREGFARNFLLPQKLALPWTRQNRSFFEAQKARSEKKRAQEKLAAEEKAKNLSDLKLKIETTAGEHNKLYGSITAEDIRKALADRGYEFDKKRIHLKEPIRVLGTHAVTLDLYPQVKATVTVEVVCTP